MKKASFIFTICLFQLIVSCKTTSKKDFVFDNEGDLNGTQIRALDSLFSAHERKTSNEIAIVTTSNYTPDTTILLFAVTFGRNLGIGKKGKNNGIVIAYSAANRQVMIATGTGTEKVLKDEIAKRIIDSLMIPAFKQGDTFQGLWLGSKAVVDYLEQPENKIN